MWEIFETSRKAFLLRWLVSILCYSCFHVERRRMGIFAELGVYNIFIQETLVQKAERCDVHADTAESNTSLAIEASCGSMAARGNYIYHKS